MKPFKIAVAGCGSMANTWIRYALERQDAEIVALVDISEENARAAAQRYRLGCGIYREIDESIRISGANLVFDVTIPEAHHSMVTTAVKMGCHVMGEKPMACSMEEARDMVAAAERYGRMYAVMQNRRYLKQIRAFRELIVSGTIGKVGFVCADFFLGPHFGGFRDIMESPLILDMAIHTFDQARFIVNADPVSVYCHEFNPPGSWYKGNAAAVCIFEFSDGSVFCYRGSWCAQGAPTSWESSWRVTGSRGTAIWDGINPPYCEVVLPGQEEKFIYDAERVESSYTWDGREGHEGCLDEMFNALLQGRKAETDCTDNIKSMAMVFGALESAKKGQKIML
ncbi:MAG: Gfo/Idh/MocA family oxidoreductase [Clostridiales bacterium]|jgi:predicted dehydrogenase|nr:Gfo/Idh/MocA family oxidoreductase [Clostridiales bacterium]